MALTLKKAKSNLIRAQKEAARAYKKVEKAFSLIKVYL